MFTSANYFILLAALESLLLLLASSFGQTLDCNWTSRGAGHRLPILTARRYFLSLLGRRQGISDEGVFVSGIAAVLLATAGWVLFRLWP